MLASLCSTPRSPKDQGRITPNFSRGRIWPHRSKPCLQPTDRPTNQATIKSTNQPTNQPTIHPPLYTFSMSIHLSNHSYIHPLCIALPTHPTIDSRRQSGTCSSGMRQAGLTFGARAGPPW